MPHPLTIEHGIRLGKRGKNSLTRIFYLVLRFLFGRSFFLFLGGFPRLFFLEKKTLVPGGWAVEGLFWGEFAVCTFVVVISLGPPRRYRRLDYVVCWLGWHSFSFPIHNGLLPTKQRRER